MSATYYKVLNEDGTPCHGGSGAWLLPVGKRPGKWMPRVAEIEPCVRGYHVCRGAADLLEWLGPTIYVVEIRGATIRDENKTVAAQARLIRPCEHWNDRTARLFAAACARDVLPIYEKAHPDDNRVRKCIESTEAFARGEIDRVVLAAAWAAGAAAGYAAWAAGGPAAGYAAGAAGGAALAAAGYATRAALAAAGAAAWDAGGAAAGAAGGAAWAAAWDAAKAAQATRLAQLLRTGDVTP